MPLPPVRTSRYPVSGRQCISLHSCVYLQSLVPCVGMATQVWAAVRTEPADGGCGYLGDLSEWPCGNATVGSQP